MPQIRQSKLLLLSTKFHVLPHFFVYWYNRQNFKSLFSAYRALRNHQSGRRK